jgi:hypothetical protein
LRARGENQAGIYFLKFLMSTLKKFFKQNFYEPRWDINIIIMGCAMSYESWDPSLEIEKCTSSSFMCVYSQMYANIEHDHVSCFVHMLSPLQKSKIAFWLTHHSGLFHRWHEKNSESDIDARLGIYNWELLYWIVNRTKGSFWECWMTLDSKL